MQTFFFRLFLVCLLAPMAVSAQEQAIDQYKNEMNQLATQSFQLAFDALAAAKHFYPFGLYVEQGEAKNIFFDKESGKQPPPANKWVKMLFAQLRERARTAPDVNVASITRLHVAKQNPDNEDGKAEPLLGVWVLVDHRHAPPVVAFMPLIKLEDGSFKPGEMVYQNTENRIFPESD